MPSAPRSEVFVADEPGIYHCYTRVVQRARLCGLDPLTGIDFTYRKAWVRDRLRALSRHMGVEVLDYGVMDNHLHLMLRNRPDVVETLTDEEVARRWCYLCPGGEETEAGEAGEGSPPGPTPARLAMLQSRQELMAEYRQRLSSISWFMRLLCQPIARRANQEVGASGRFFADRFKCKRIEDEAGLLACSIYVNLNPIRAGLANCPQEAEYTAGFDRILALLQRRARGEDKLGELTPDPRDPDAWLAPLFLDPRGADYAPQALADRGSGSDSSGSDTDLDLDLSPAEGAEPESPAVAGEQPASCPEAGVGGVPDGAEAEVPSAPSALLADGASASEMRALLANPFASPRLTNKGYLPMTVDDYLNLLDWTARQLHAESPETIPAPLESLLERLSVRSSNWLETLQNYEQSFSSSVGRWEAIKQRAVQRGRKWLRGLRHAAAAFL